MKKILVVEDAPTQARRTQLILQTQGYEIIMAADGEEGFRKAVEDSPDLIISDIVMPVIDGYKLCSLLKKKEETKNIPFVLLTQKHDITDIIKGLEVGADNFITKPFDSRYLLERVSSIFENLRLKDEGVLKDEIDEFAEKISLNTNRQQILQLILSTLSVIVNCEIIGLLMLSTSKEKSPLHLVSFQPVSAITQKNFTEKFVNSLNALGFKDFDLNKILLCINIIDPQLAENQQTFESYVNVPLYMKGNLIGLLGAASSLPFSLSAEDIKKLYQIGLKSINAFNKIER